MIKMKDSGVEWIGDIPINWEIKKFKYFFDIIGGNGFKDEFQGNETGEIPFCKASDINGNNKYVSGAKNYVSYELANSQKYNVIPANSILISKIGEALRKNHRKINTVPCIVDNNCEAFTTNRDDNIDFLYYVMKYIDMDWFDNGGTIPSVNNSKLKEFYLPFPNILIQEKIAKYLDEKCAKIDKIIEKQQAMIEKLKEYKLSVITEAVTTGIEKNGNYVDSGVEGIGKIASTWKVAQISKLHNGLTDGTHGTFTRKETGRLLLSSKNVREDGLEIGDNESYISEEDYQSIVANGFPQKDDVLLCCIGASIGRCTIYTKEEPEAFQRSVIFIRCNKNYILPEFMCYSLKSKSTLHQEQLLVNQSAQPGLYQGLVSKIHLAVPSIAEQNNIVEFLNDKCKLIDKIVNKRQSIIDKLNEYKKSLIYEVVTGKKEV